MQVSWTARCNVENVCKEGGHASQLDHTIQCKKYPTNCHIIESLDAQADDVRMDNLLLTLLRSPQIHIDERKIAMHDRPVQTLTNDAKRPNVALHCVTSSLE